MKKILSLFLVLAFGLALVGCNETTDDDKTYNIVLTNATIPPLMASLDALDNGNETLMWYGRSQTFFNVRNLGTNFTLVGDPENTETAITGIVPEVVTEMTNRVLDLFYQSNEKAKFNLYITDYGVKVALQMFVESKIPEANYNVYLLEDGNGSYEQFVNIDNYAKEGGKALFDANLEKLNTIIDSVKKGTYVWDIGNVQNWELSFAYATKPNVEYWLQYPEALTSEDPEMQSLLDAGTINFKKKKLTDTFNALSAEKQDVFKSAILDIATFNPLINLNNGKKTLLVTGTSYDGEELGLADGKIGDGEFEIAMNYIIENYGTEYNILFKPHPAWMPSLGDDRGARWETHLGKDRPSEWLEILTKRVNYLKDNNIGVLPGQTPIEPILWSFPDVTIGGYNSSLYMNASNTQVLFFLLPSNSFTELSNPLPIIIENGGLLNPTTQKNPLIISPETFGIPNA